MNVGFGRLLSFSCPPLEEEKNISFSGAKVRIKI
jgi:hypothetical protein